MWFTSGAGIGGILLIMLKIWIDVIVLLLFEYVCQIVSAEGKQVGVYSI